MECLNVKIINEITKYLSGKEKILDYLMETLCIGKESAYRRIKGQIPFTFEEIVKIAQDLHFSIDQLLEKKTCTRAYFDIQVDYSQDPIHIYANMMEQTISALKELSAAKKHSIIAAFNRIPFRFFPYKTLFKYEYYSYLHSYGYLLPTTPFSEVSIPPQINRLHEEIVHHFSLLQNITCIFDNTFVQRGVAEILHSSTLDILSDEDVRAIQSESFDMLAWFESMLWTGKNKTDNNYSFYYSKHPVDSNHLYYEYDNAVTSQLWLCPESPIVVINNQLLYTMQKRQMEAIIRYSTLISRSNPELQTAIIKEFHSHISHMQK